MINIEPQSSLMILNTPLLSDNKNQLTFSNQNAQTNYFLSKVIYNLGNSFTYIKKDMTEYEIGKNLRNSMVFYGMTSLLSMCCKEAYFSCTFF